MRCEDVTTLLADYLAGTLTDEALAQIRVHLTGCAACRDEVDAMDDTWQMLGSIAPERPDSGAMRARLDAVLEGYQQGMDETFQPSRASGRLAPRRASADVTVRFRGPSRRSAIASAEAEAASDHRLLPRRPGFALQAMAAAALLVIGVLVGRQASAPPAPASDAQLGALREELGDMRLMMTLSLLQQQSASERLRGVTFTSQIAQPGAGVVTALLDTLMHDQNVNVRLASIDALERFAEQDTVRRGSIEALPLQTSPLVQIALIDFVLHAAGLDSAEALRRLSRDTMLDAAVRARAARGLEQLGSEIAIARIGRIAVILFALAGIIEAAADYRLREDTVITRTLRFGGQGERTLDIRNLHGSIRVTGATTDVVQLEARRTVAANSERDMRRAEAEAVLSFIDGLPKIEAVVQEPNGPVCGEPWDGGWRQRPSYHVTYDITVTVPARTRLRLCTINGREISVNGTTGHFEIENVNGRITMNDVRGSGSATTVNGPVTASFLDVPREDSLFKTVNGDLRVTWPEGLAATLKMKTFNGGLFTDFDATPLPQTAPVGQRANGRFLLKSNEFTSVRIGRGGPEITLESFNGDVRVLRAAR